MSEAKFTKGEWKVEEGNSMSMGANYRGNFSVTSNFFDGNIDYASKANAQLIAVAPDMYNELQSLLDIFNHESKSVTILDVMRIEKLLAKARCES